MKRTTSTLLILLGVMAIPGLARAQVKYSWEFEDGNNPPFHDEITNLAANSLVGIAGANAGWTTTVHDFATAFPAGGYLHTPAGISLGAPAEITVDFWAKVPANSPVSTVIYKKYAGQPTISVQVLPVGGAFDALFTTSGLFGPCVYNTHSYYPGLIPAETWVHYTMLYDGSMLRVFIDGAELGDPSSTIPLTECIGGPLADDPTQPLIVGGQADKTLGQAQYPFTNGQVDDLRIIAGRDAPHACPTLPVAMVDSRAGFCVDHAPTLEVATGDAMNKCAARSATVCTYSQLYTASYLSNPAITMTTGAPLATKSLAYQTGDLMYDKGGNYHFGGWDNQGQVGDLLVPPAVAGPMGGPPGWTGVNAGVDLAGNQVGNGPMTIGAEGRLQSYFCCIPK